jgi:predicted  nucleic acid-binding Zn-ribbon protein
VRQESDPPEDAEGLRAELEQMRRDLADLGAAFDAARSEAAQYEQRLGEAGSSGADARLAELAARLDAEREKLADTELIAQEALGERVALEDEVQRLRAPRPRSAAKTIVLVLVAVLIVLAVLLLSGAVDLGLGG